MLWKYTKIFKFGIYIYIYQLATLAPTNTEHVIQTSLRIHSITQRFPKFFWLTSPFENLSILAAPQWMKPKFANLKFYQKNVFKSCSLFKMRKNFSVYSQNTEKRLMWAVSLLFCAHFIKPRCNVWHCNTHVAFSVNLAAVVGLDYCCRRKTGFTQVWRCKQPKNTNLQVEIQI